MEDVKSAAAAELLVCERLQEGRAPESSMLDMLEKILVESVCSMAIGIVVLRPGLEVSK